MTRLGGLVRWFPAIALVAGSVVVGFAQLGGDEGELSPERLAISSSAPKFALLAELVAASDVVLVGTVAGTEQGRTVTAPDDPDSGIRTRLVDVDVTQILVGEVPARIVVEEAATLTDGTPIAVDGMNELRDGDRAVWFLVAGGSDSMPYFAAVNGQARYEVVGDTLEAGGGDALSRQLVALGVGGLTEAILDLASRS